MAVKSRGREAAVESGSLDRGIYESGTVPIHYSGWVPKMPVQHYPALEGELAVDIVVIGAGLAGSSLALHLAEQGASVAVLEAAQPGNGASGRNAGHVQPFLEDLEALRNLPNQGKPFLDFFMQHRDIVFDLCHKYEIAADAVRSGMVEAATKKQASLVKKAKAWKAYGYEVTNIGGHELRQLLGSDAYQHGLHWDEGGRVNPYLFTNGLIAAAAKLGAVIHGDSPVLSCSREGSSWRVTTSGGNVLAQQLLLCTNGHAGNLFFPELARTQYPLVACGLASKPLPQEVLESVNPARVALMQVPLALYPLVIDERNRFITSTIPSPGKSHSANTYFDYFLRYLHRTFPQTREADIQLETYWTGMTANSSHVYSHDFPKIYQVDDGVMALMNLGTWGNLMGPLLGMNLAHALMSNRLQDLILPVEEPAAVKFPWLFDFKIRRTMIPIARLVDLFGIA